MKKWLIFALALCLLLLTACGAEETSYDWGITLTAENATPTGCTLICTQTGGEIGGLYTGYDWFLTKETWNNWKQVYPAQSYDIPGGVLGIQKEGITEWELSYPELEPGNYRACRTIMGYTEQGLMVKKLFWAEFTIQ